MKRTLRLGLASIALLLLTYGCGATGASAPPAPAPERDGWRPITEANQNEIASLGYWFAKKWCMVIDTPASFTYATHYVPLPSPPRETPP